jgi:acetate kinase
MPDGAMPNGMTPDGAMPNGMTPDGAILTVNAGSSSLKFALYETGAELRPLLSGKVAGIGGHTKFSAKGTDGVAIDGPPDASAGSHEDVFAKLLPWLTGRLGRRKLVGAGHRVVHGGRKLVAPVRVDAEVLAELDSLVPLAPLHQPHALSALRALQSALPDLPQVACFDTAFHRSMAPEVRHFALPRELTDEGVERYGFHGLSYEYIASVLPEHAPEQAQGRIVIAHLGSGASLCALRRLTSVDTTMSFTALDGLVMSTRCGTLDPGVVLYLLQTKGLSPGAIETLLYEKSGLLGVSGITGDMRDLLGNPDERAREAVSLFVFRVARELCAMLAALGGLDGIVFTAGIGENAPQLRREVCDHLAWLGVELDAAANAAGKGCISAGSSRIKVWVIPTDEETMIARHTVAVLQ